MDRNEWKEKQAKKPAPQYTHFDRRVSLVHCFEYVTSPEKVSHHGFYPFIHYTIKSRKVKDGRKERPKERQIYYAAHLDGWIYRYYSYLINEAYNQKVKVDDIDDVAVAYRTDLGKSNIHFAKTAFDHISKARVCYVRIGDFTDFFDNLNHVYLKKQLCELLSVSRLPDDFYAVYKNVTHFSYVELNDLLELNGLEDTPKGRKEFNSRTRERAIPLEQFREDKKLIRANPHKDYGVPQGSPISAVLANVYMLSADRKLKEYVSSFGGFYMRYSDDFMIVLPQGDIDFPNQYKYIKQVLDSIPNLVLKGSKTKLFRFENESVINCTSQFIADGGKGKSIIDFLGFSFDGKTVRIRDKTISKYYNRMYRKINTIVKDGGYTPTHKRISGKNLYLKYSYKGSQAYLKKVAKKTGIPLDKKQTRGNFLDYVARAKREFREFHGEEIDITTKKHMQKIRKRLKRVK